MDVQLNEQLDRIERALTQLTRSISAYNPNTDAAKELVSANSALDKGILDLSTHQRNHQQTQSLQSTLTDLDVQTTGQLRALDELRRSIKSAPLHAPPENARPIPAADIVSHGIAIAKFQAPASYKPPSAVQPAAAAVDSEAQTQLNTAQASPEESVSPVRAPGTAAASPEPPFTPAVSQAMAVDDARLTQEDEEPNQAIRALSDEERAQINPVEGFPFSPWVADNMIANSRLAQYQGKATRVLQRLEAEEKEFENYLAIQEEQRRREREAAEETERARLQAMNAQSGQGRNPAPAKPKGVFGGWDDE